MSERGGVIVGQRETYQKVLMRACMVAGDETLLAKQIGVPVAAVVDWLLGESPVPPEVFLRAVDIVTTVKLVAHQKKLEDSRERVKSSRALLEQIKFRHRRSLKA